MSLKITIALSFTLITVLASYYFYKNKAKLKKILKFISDKKISAPAEIIVLLATAYFAIVKKVMNYSLTDSLQNHIPENITKSIIYILLAIIIVAVIIKAISIVCDKFKILERDNISPDGLKLICLKLNEEIETHIREYDKKTKNKAMQELCTHHHFEQNITLIVVNLIEHLNDSLNIKKKKKDIFLSIYYVENFENEVGLVEYDRNIDKFNEPNEKRVSKLKYLTHWDSSSSHRYSKAIDITSNKYEKYECVRAYKKGKYLHTKVESSEYYCDPDNPRAQTTKNFLCFFIEVSDIVVGLVNIEFHNHNVFDTEEDMIQYIETDLLPFKYMIQYQFLKKRFLTLLTR